MEQQTTSQAQQENSGTTDTNNDLNKKTADSSKKEMHITFDKIELQPITIQASPQKSISINLSSLSGTLTANNTENVKVAHTKYILQNIRFVATLYFVCIAILSVVDIRLIAPIIHKAMTIYSNYMLIALILLLHLAFIGLLICCICYTSKILKNIYNATNAANAPNITNVTNVSNATNVTNVTNVTNAINTTNTTYNNLRILYCFIYSVGLAIYLIAAITCLLTTIN